MAIHYFPFGKYEGKGISQTALAVGNVTGKGGWGYPYLKWAYHNMTNVGSGLRNDMERHIEILNNFPSPCKCRNPECNEQQPKLFSIYQNHQGSHITGAHIYCSNDCAYSMGASRVKLVPLGFDALCSIPTFEKITQEQAHRVFRGILGWPEHKPVTKEAAATFIDDLESRLKSLGRI